MSQKETILKLLNSNGAMSQSALAEAMYGDKNHGHNIYSALMKLVNSGVVLRNGKKPAYYSLPESETIHNKTVQTKKDYRDVIREIITDEVLEETEALVQDTDYFGPENELIERCLIRFPSNTDPDVVAMKIGLIYITNSTRLSLLKKSSINMVELSYTVASIPNIDERIKAGDPEVVNEIARCNGKINLFSFASKYCCYHNKNLYGRDDYSILDTVLKESLPKYFDDVTKSQIQRWQDGFQYKDYNDYITRKLDELGINIEFRKRKFDHFVWFNNR